MSDLLDAPTVKQLDYCKALFAERDLGEHVDFLRRFTERLDADELTKQDASATITWLQGRPKLARPHVVPAAPVTEAPEGMHVHNGRIFKVVRGQDSGRLYAKELVDGTFVMAPRAVRRLSESTVMSLEQAQTYGRIYGTCCRCGRTLTDENSIAAGIGPVCAAKW